ncbi:MAG: 16S rRNA (cytosine(1402)-N(4))-methyltransferase RsmH [Ruminococcaceae bacterium]|nr:16S rRNA (cytosine(1402)-N(4))-methyltransferase RsmH [Oscillospiraceae bacterium]
MEFNHISVLFNECIDALNIKENGIYVDGTAGGAGHSTGIAKKLKNGKLYALDRDPDAVATATERLKDLPAEVINCNFKDMARVLNERGVNAVDGILLDLGVSSYQLDNGERGFSYHKDAYLDMRMSKSGVTAAELVNSLEKDELAKIFRDYGEEKFSFRIAEKIVKAREVAPIETTSQLSDIISSAYPAAARRDGHPARKCFQALRIAVNGELDSLSLALDDAFELLAPNGVLAIITFHSLEDRMVKQKFKEYTTGCICPSDFPVCVCGKTPRGILPHRKPIEPSADELSNNPRSRSAKLRVIIKV